MQVINGLYTKPHNQTVTTVRPPLTPLQLLRCAGSEICTLLAGTEGTPQTATLAVCQLMKMMQNAFF